MVFGNSPIVSVRNRGPSQRSKRVNLSRSKGNKVSLSLYHSTHLHVAKVGMGEGLGTLFIPYIVLNGVQKRLAMVFGNSLAPR